MDQTEQLTIKQTSTGYWSVQRGSVHLAGAPTRPTVEIARALRSPHFDALVNEFVEIYAFYIEALGVDGLVSSPEEAAALRKIVGHRMNLVTPGIRPAGTASGDQKRIMTPARAIAAGADYLVVGRPVMEAADPKAAANAIVAEIEQALG